jgi:hypothetical protein
VISDGEYIHVFYRAVSKGNYSTIGYCKLKGPLQVEERYDVPVVFSNLIMNLMVWKIRVLSGLKACIISLIQLMMGHCPGALAVSKDLQHFEKLV